MESVAIKGHDIVKYLYDINEQDIILMKSIFCLWF